MPGHAPALRPLRLSFFCCALAAACGAETEEDPPQVIDDLRASGAFLYGAADLDLPPLASGGQMEFTIVRASGHPLAPYTTATGQRISVARDGDLVRLTSDLETDDTLSVFDLISGELLESFEISSAPIAEVQLLRWTSLETFTGVLNPPPRRPLALLAGAQATRFTIGLLGAGTTRLLDHALTVRSPDGATLTRGPHWDVIALQAAAAGELRLELTAGGRAWTAALPVVAAIERISAPPFSAPLVAGELRAVCFEAITGERAVQGASWTFTAQRLSLLPVAAPGCVMISAENPGDVSITASAGAQFHTLTFAVLPR